MNNGLIIQGMAKDRIERLKDSLRIEEVVGRYVQLQRVGRLWRGLCPFHGDRHPSLTVNPERQTFVCYACGEKGDVFSFVQKIENCSFTGALDKLGAHLLDKQVAHSLDKPVCNLKEQGVANLTPNPEQFLNLLFPCASGHSDLSGTWLDFEVGQSPCQLPGEWRAMRNRIIFPIRDEEGRLVGFAARRLSDGEADKDSPKYINSAASGLYRKSELLYGLYRAKEAIRREGYVFVVEGYKDVLAMHAAGLAHTVALCGTALCPGHIALLKKYTSDVYLLLDGDKAGIAASGRASSLLREAEMEVAVCRLPEGEDPDSLFRLHGKEGFRSLLETVRQEVAPSAEGLVLRRIRRGIGLLSAVSGEESRRPLLSLLGTCIDSLVGMSHQSGRPATMDWRWI